MKSDTMSAPLISIITATYNRSNVLRHSIRTVINQTHEDWELIVVGDCCTDDTAEVVAGFNDQRISFLNLPVNTGEQSGPNNEGLKQAKGQYLAYLNHDDLWFPDHLKVLLEKLETSDADLVWAIAARLRPDGEFILMELPPRDHYQPHAPVPASLWLMRREFAISMGGWRHYREIYNIPSQDFLFRAAGQGRKLLMSPRLTAILVQSALRPGVYVKREHEENEQVCERILTDPGFREHILTSNAVMDARRRADPPVWPTVRFVFRRQVRNLVAVFTDRPRIKHVYAPLKQSCIRWYRKVVSRAGVPPGAVDVFMKTRQKGGAIDKLREGRGLDRKPLEGSKSE